MEDHMGLNLAKLSGGTTATSQEMLDALKARVRAEEEKDRVVSAYLGNSERLATIKAKYDPHNLFRMNQNIRPTP
jgi:FAD/FMN-containing dehydrogenase